MSSPELLLLIALVAISGFLSSSEIALFSLSRFQLRGLKERFRTSHRQIKELLADPGGLLITILVANEIVNVSMSSLLGTSVSSVRAEYLPHPTFMPAWMLDTILGTLVTTPILLFVCEVTPKVIGAKANRLVATINVQPLHLIYHFLKPVRVLLKKVVNLTHRRTAPTLPSSESTNPELLLKESEFILMVEEGHKEGAIQQDELGLIKNVFDLDDTTVLDVFTPLVQTRAIPVNTTLKSAFVLCRGLEHYSRIPVLGRDRRQIVGILHAKDLLKAKIETDLMTAAVETIMRKPITVSPSMKLNAVFRKLKQNKTHMAIVQETPFSASLGIITMKDIFDTLFDDIFPDGDEDEETEVHTP